MKYIILIFLLLGSCTFQKEERDQSIKDLRESLNALKCLVELQHEDKSITRRKACEYHGRQKGCELTKEEVYKYLDDRCPKLEKK